MTETLMRHPVAPARCPTTEVVEAPDSTIRPSPRILRLGDDRTREWDEFVLSHPQGTLFHTWGWRQAVREVFPHEPVYLGASRGARLCGALPTFFIRSRLFGRMLVSVPYGVGGGILADDDETAVMLLETARREARDRGCRFLDLRSERAAVAGAPIVDRYVGFRRELPSSVEQVAAWIPRKARAAARNAREKFGVEIRYGIEQLPLVWGLYTKNMKRLASIAYPFTFFERLSAAFLNHCWVSAAVWRGKPVAGLVTFLFRKDVVPYFIGAGDEARKCSAANLLYLDAVERGVAEGFRYFDFGRTRRDNAGSLDFKRFHGFEPHPLQYQRISLTKEDAPNLSPNQRKFQLARAVWRRLPLCATTSLSARLAAHIPG